MEIKYTPSKQEYIEYPCIAQNEIGEVALLTKGINNLIYATVIDDQREIKTIRVKIEGWTVLPKGARLEFEN